jgi:hypothetical protein
VMELDGRRIHAGFHDRARLQRHGVGARSHLRAPPLVDLRMADLGLVEGSAASGRRCSFSVSSRIPTHSSSSSPRSPEKFNSPTSCSALLPDLHIVRSELCLRQLMRQDRDPTCSALEGLKLLAALRERKPDYRGKTQNHLPTDRQCRFSEDARGRYRTCIFCVRVRA